MAITPLPTPVPNSTMSEGVFDEAADNFLGALPDFATEANALASDVNEKASTATGAASTATTKAGEAATSADTASTKAGEATTSAGNAATSASNAEASLTSIYARHLGSYANDGAADAAHPSATNGAFYYNTTSGDLRLRSAGAWTNAVLDAAGALLAANNLSDVASGPAAIANIGGLPVAGGTMIGAVSQTPTAKGTVSSGTVTFDVGASNVQTLTVGGSLTIALSNKPTGYWELEIILTNGGSAVVTFPTVSWLKGDGTTSAAFADMGVTLAVSGTNTIILWGVGAGTVYGRAG